MGNERAQAIVTAQERILDALRVGDGGNLEGLALMIRTDPASMAIVQAMIDQNSATVSGPSSKSTMKTATKIPHSEPITVNDGKKKPTKRSFDDISDDESEIASLRKKFAYAAAPGEGLTSYKERLSGGEIPVGYVTLDPTPVRLVVARIGRGGDLILKIKNISTTFVSFKPSEDHFRVFTEHYKWEPTNLDAIVGGGAVTVTVPLVNSYDQIKKFVYEQTPARSRRSYGWKDYNDITKNHWLRWTKLGQDTMAAWSTEEMTGLQPEDHFGKTVAKAAEIAKLGDKAAKRLASLNYRTTEHLRLENPAGLLEEANRIVKEVYKASAELSKGLFDIRYDDVNCIKTAVTPTTEFLRRAHLRQEHGKLRFETGGPTTVDVPGMNFVTKRQKQK